MHAAASTHGFRHNLPRMAGSLLLQLALLVPLLLGTPAGAFAATPLKAPVATVQRTAVGAQVTWPRVRHAVRYRVTYGTAKTPGHAKTKVTRKPQVTLRVGAQRYYLRVTALGRHGATRQGRVVVLPRATAVLPTGVRALPGDQQFTLAWEPRGGARYTLQYGTDTRLKDARSLDVATMATYTVRGLTNDTRYYYRFVARAGGRATKTGAIQAVTPSTILSAKPTIRVRPTADNVLHVAWSGVTRGTVAVVTVAANNAMTRGVFTAPRQRITASEQAVRIPARLRPILGAGSGNPVYVRVYLYNTAGVQPTDTAGIAADLPFRTSDAAVTFMPSPATAGGVPLRVASYNMQSVTASLAQSNYPYPERRAALVAAVAAADPDILIAQELTWRAVQDGSKVTQAADMAHLLGQQAHGGYAWATPRVQLASWPGGSSAGVNIFYKKQVATVLAVKVLPASALAVNYPTDLVDQYWAVVKFKLRATGKVFYVVGAHLPPGIDGATHALRNRLLTAMDQYVTNGAGDAPIIFAGDFNGAVTDSDTPEAATLIGRGYLDAAATANRAGQQYATENQDERPTARHGYPDTPTPYTNLAPRIDYIMTKHMPASDGYKNQVILRADGTFDPAYQGSDHSLQVTRLRVR